MYTMGRNGHGLKWSWAEMVMGRNDPDYFKLSEYEVAPPPFGCLFIDFSDEISHYNGGLPA